MQSYGKLDALSVNLFLIFANFSRKTIVFSMSIDTMKYISVINGQDAARSPLLETDLCNIVADVMRCSFVHGLFMQGI